jgi:hypothetical protein
MGLRVEGNGVDSGRTIGYRTKSQKNNVIIFFRVLFWDILVLADRFQARDEVLTA